MDSMDLRELEALFKDAGLDQYLEKAAAWCDAEGARFIYEIKENFDDVVEALALERLEKTRLETALSRAAAASPASPASPLPPAAPSAPAPAPPRQRLAPPRNLADYVQVKNTFLDLDDSQRTDLFRTKTAPAAGAARDDSDGDEDAHEVSDDDAGDDGAEVPREVEPRGLADLSRYKTMTVNDYEPLAAWGWVDPSGEVHGDPNAAAAAAAAAVAAPPEQQQAAPPLLVGGGAMLVPVGFMPVNPFKRWADEEPTPAPDAAPPAAAEAPPDAVAPKARDQMIQRAFSTTSMTYRIRWTVDSRRLKSADREAASPVFELSFAGPVEFRMILKPRVVHDAKGGASFKKAQGWGSVDLRCLSDVDKLTNPAVTFRLQVGSFSNPKKQQRARGPIKHDFRERPICGLEGRNEWWDFQRSVDTETRSFVVCLEVFPGNVD